MFSRYVVYYAVRLVPRMNGQSEFVMVDGEDLLGLEIKDDFLKVFRRGVDIFPIGIVLPILQ